MRERQEFRIIAEEIVNSYEIKVKTVTSLIRQVVQNVKIFYEEQIKMADRLKDILAKNQSLRKKDFDAMIADIQTQQAKREKEITHMIEKFCKEEEEIVARLRTILSGKTPCTLKEFELLRKKMMEHPKEREKNFSRMLKNFHRDQKQLVAALRRLLEKGPAVRIKDFKAMIKAFHIEHQEEICTADEILEEFERIKDEISHQWRKVIAIESKGEYRVPLAKS